jgi:NAD(P)-dependent dehydrogenase (short-subunit alcohol dehydrogenase family)
VFSTTHTADHLKEIVELIAPQGRLALINNEPLELALLMRKCVSIHWESMFTRSMLQTADMAEQHALLDNVAGLVDAGKIRSTVAEHFGTINAANLKRAHALLETGRVVSVSSTGHLFSPVIFDDLNFDFVPYTPIGAYGQSKTADALLAVGITKRWADDGIRSNTLHPGAIATGLQKYTGGLKTPPDRRKTPEQGASTSVLLAASPLLDGISGLYFEDCNEAQQVTKRPSDFTGGYAGYALDLENAERLWNLSMKLIS